MPGLCPIRGSGQRGGSGGGIRHQVIKIARDDDIKVKIQAGTGCDGRRKQADLLPPAMVRDKRLARSNTREVVRRDADKFVINTQMLCDGVA